MEIDQLVDAACERAGSTTSARTRGSEGLEVLVRLAGRPRRRSTSWASAAMTDQIVGYLVNRLEVEQWYARAPRDRRPGDRRPAVRARACPAPGRPRSSFLLAQDPARRSLRVWEAATPCPPPETATEHTDPRIAEAQAGIDFTNEMFPGFAGMLPTAADGPQECLLLMALDFRSLIFEGMALHPELQRVAAAVRHGAGLPVPPAGAEAAPVALPARPVVAEDAGAHALDRRARRRVPRRPVRDDPPRRRQGAAVGVRALRHASSSVLTDRPDPVAIGAHNVERLADRARAADRLPRPGQRATGSTTCRSRPCSATRSAEVDRALRRARRRAHRRGPPAHGGLVGRELQGALRARTATTPTTFGLDLAAIREQFAFYYDRFDVPVDTDLTGRTTDGRDHPEGRRRHRVAGVLRPARRRRRGHPRRGQPRRPARPGRGLPDAHPAAARRAGEQARVRPGHRARCSICTCHETIKIVGENPDNHYLGASLDGKYDYRIWGTRGEAKWISFNLFSGAGFGGGGPGTGATLHEEQMHIEPDGTLRADHLPARAPGELAALRGRHPVARHPPDVPRQAEPGATPSSTSSASTTTTPPPEPLTAEELYLSLLYAGFYVKGVAEIGAEWATRQSQWPNVFTDEAELAETDKFKDPQIKWHQALLRPGRRRGARRRGHAARVRVLDDRPPQPLDGDARLRPPPGHAELPLGRSSSPTAACGS